MTRTIFLLPLVALAAGCTTPYGTAPDSQGPYGTPEPYPAPYPTPYPQYPQPMPQPMPIPAGETYRAVGNEPFWDLTIGREMVFTDRGTNVQVIQATPTPSRGVVTDTYWTPRMKVDIRMESCSDGMSDRRFPHSVTVTVDGRLYRGCGAPASFYSQVGENGLPNPYPGAGVGTLANTEWRVFSVNGRQVPQGDYYLRFDANRLDAKFGCNGLGAGYSTSGSMLNVGALMATRMACPDMSYESAGSAILSKPLTVDLSNPEWMVLTNASGSIVARKVTL